VRRRDRTGRHHDDDSDRFPALTTSVTDKLYPKDFKLVGIPKYDGKQDPRQWIRCYSIAIEVLGGSNSTKVPFYGIVPGNAATPLGSVVLPVTFGTKDNYCTEYIKFKVADFDLSYHAILGRLALAKFMVMPHYIYLLLKMPSKIGVLTLHGDLKKSYDCDQEVIDYATTSCVPEPSVEVLAAALKLTNVEMEISNQRPSQSRVKPNPNDVGIKAIQLQEGDPSKTALIGGGLGDK
jgi:hypothetical protein